MTVWWLTSDFFSQLRARIVALFDALSKRNRPLRAINSSSLSEVETTIGEKSREAVTDAWSANASMSPPSVEIFSPVASPAKTSSFGVRIDILNVSFIYLGFNSFFFRFGVTFFYIFDCSSHVECLFVDVIVFTFENFLE